MNKNLRYHKTEASTVIQDVTVLQLRVDDHKQHTKIPSPDPAP